MPTRKSTASVGRFIDLLFPDADDTESGAGSGGGGATDGHAFASNCEHTCGAPAEAAERLVAVLANPTPQPDPNGPDEDPPWRPFVPVFGSVRPCQKDWVNAEAYVDYDMGLGYVKRVSAEMTMQLNSMTLCTPAGKPCPHVLLTYHADQGGWTGSIALNLGTATFRVYGTFDGLLEHWFVEFGGCAETASGTAAPLGIDCGDPLRLTGTGGGGVFGAACCGPLLLPPDTISIWAKIPPVYQGRLVDILPAGDDVDGSGHVKEGGDGRPVPVYAALECCLDGCRAEGCGCALPIDGNLVFTVFNFRQTGPACGSSCAYLSQTPTTANGCFVWSTTCGGIMTCCLVCVGGPGWESYWIQTTGLFPVSTGRCSPFTLTFHGLPWTAPGPLGTCSGTYSLTVTRP